MVLLLLTQGTYAQVSQAVPEKEITKLRTMLVDSQKSTSNVARRRGLKSVARKANALIRKSPEAPNRFDVLGVALECQKRILSLENNERNRMALFNVCEALSKAPDSYAELRLDADLLLSEKQLSEAKATLKERADALAKILELGLLALGELDCTPFAEIPSKPRSSGWRIADRRFSLGHCPSPLKPSVDGTVRGGSSCREFR